jgi:hypothetical protein
MKKGNEITLFFNKQPYTKYMLTDKGILLFTEWYDISDKKKIKELIQLGYEVQDDKVRKRYLIKKK